jgi:hypothetical protein
MDVSDVTYIHDGAVDLLDRKIVQFPDSLGTRVQHYVVFELADLLSSRGKNEILR